MVEERHTREYFTGNVTAEGLINAEIDTDYGARPSLQVRRVSPPRPLKTWPTAPTRRTRNNKSCRSGSFFHPPIDYRQINTILRSAAATIGRNPSGCLDTHHRRHTIGLVIHLSETRNTVAARAFSFESESGHEERTCHEQEKPMGRTAPAGSIPRTNAAT